MPHRKILKKMKVKDLKRIIKKHKLGRMKGLKKLGLASLISSHKNFKQIMNDVVSPPKGPKRRVPQHVLDALAKGRAIRAQRCAEKKGRKCSPKEIVKETFEEVVEVAKPVVKQVEKVIEKQDKGDVSTPLMTSFQRDNKQQKVSKDIKRKENILEKLDMLDKDDIRKMIRKVAMELLTV